MPIDNFNLEIHKKGFSQPITGKQLLRENEKNKMLRGTAKKIAEYEESFPSRFEPKTDK